MLRIGAVETGFLCGSRHVLDSAVHEGEIGVFESGAFTREFFCGTLDRRKKERDERFGFERTQVAGDGTEFAIGSRRNERDAGDGTNEIALDREEIGEKTLQLRAWRSRDGRGAGGDIELRWCRGV